MRILQLRSLGQDFVESLLPFPPRVSLLEPAPGWHVLPGKVVLLSTSHQFRICKTECPWQRRRKLLSSFPTGVSYDQTGTKVNVLIFTYNQNSSSGFEFSWAANESFHNTKKLRSNNCILMGSFWFWWESTKRFGSDSPTLEYIPGQGKLGNSNFESTTQ